MGDIIIQGGDIFGDGVNVAARLEGVAEPGGICVSRAVHDQIGNRLDISFTDMGERALKNIAQAIRVFRVDRAGAPASLTSPAAQPEMAPVSEAPSIAVLAFNNMSGDAEQEYFSDGISEDIITDLSKLPGLRVIARNSSFTYKGRAVDVKQVGRELGVRYVLEGSVRKAGNRVRVTGQLIDAANGAHVWADRFDRELTDIFAVQDELTREIIAALRVTLTPEMKGRLAHKATIDVEAYNLFLRAREQALLLTRTGNIEARSLLGRAIAISPEFAAAHAYIAFTHLNDFVNDWADAPEKSFASLVEFSERAVALDGDEPYARFVRAETLLYRREHDRALAEVAHCLALAPSSAEGHFARANILYFSGDAAGSLATLNAYIALDPFYHEITLYFLAQAHEALGQFDEAIDALTRRLARNPNSYTSWALLAACYGHLGRIDESRAAWAELMKLAPDYSIERRRDILPFRDPGMFEHRLDGLRKAGLPV